MSNIENEEDFGEGIDMGPSLLFATSVLFAFGVFLLSVATGLAYIISRNLC